MGAYLLTAGTFKMKVQTGKRVRKYEHDTHVHLDELAMYKSIVAARDAVMAVLNHLVGAYAYQQAEKLKLEIADYPPHSIFCECDGCDPKHWLLSHSRVRKDTTK